MANRIQIRRDTAANWTAVNPILTQGELGYELNTGRLKVGNGTAAWTALAYFNDGQDFSGNYADLTGAPTALSEFTNDTGFITLADVVTDTGNLSFVNTTMYNTTGVTVSNRGDTTGATAFLQLPADSGPTINIQNNYGDVQLVSGTNPGSTNTWVFESTGGLTFHNTVQTTAYVGENLEIDGGNAFTVQIAEIEVDGGGA